MITPFGYFVYVIQFLERFYTNPGIIQTIAKKATLI